ncbi:MAG: 2-dehydropantoate 2-reductase [Bacteroidota bacterium]
MHIVVYGTGGVGGYFGGRLAQAGNQVTFIARGAHLEAIKKEGLTVKSIKGDFHIEDAVATDDVPSIGKADLILFAVKSWQVTEAAQSALPIIHEHTTLLPLENGITSFDEIADMAGRSKVLAGLCRIISYIESPGVICHAGHEPSISFGEIDNNKSDRVQAIDDLFTNAGIKSQVPDDIEAEIWKKFLFIATMSGIGAITRVPVGIFRSVDNTREMMVAMLREIFELAKAKGINLPEEVIDKTLSFIDSLPEGATASMQRDIMEGKPSELEAQTGTVVKLGQTLGIPTPVNNLVYYSLLPQEMKVRNAN